MTSAGAVAVGAFLQMFLRISFFIEQDSDVCSTAPTLASWIFLIAFLDVLLDICVYPICYMHLPYICQIIAETIVTVLLTEFGTLVVWCKIERITCKLCKTILLLMGMSSEFYNCWENYILGTATTSVSLAILLSVAQATDHLHFMRKKSFRLCRKLTTKSLEVWHKLRSLMASQMPENSEPITDKCNGEELLDLGTGIYNARRNNSKRVRGRAKGSRSRSRSRR